MGALPDGWDKEWEHPRAGGLGLEHPEVQVQGAAGPRWGDLHHLRASGPRATRVLAGEYLRLLSDDHRLHLRATGRGPYELSGASRVKVAHSLLPLKCCYS